MISAKEIVLNLRVLLPRESEFIMFPLHTFCAPNLLILDATTSNVVSFSYANFLFCSP